MLTAYDVLLSYKVQKTSTLNTEVLVMVNNQPDIIIPTISPKRPSTNFDPTTGKKLRIRVPRIHHCDKLHEEFAARGYDFCPNCGGNLKVKTL